MSITGKARERSGAFDSDDSDTRHYSQCCVHMSWIHLPVKILSHINVTLCAKGGGVRKIWSRNQHNLAHQGNMLQFV